MGCCASLSDSKVVVHDKKPMQHRPPMTTNANSPQRRRRDDSEPTIEEGMSCLSMYLKN